MTAALEWGDRIPIGLVYRESQPRPSLDTRDPGLERGVLVQQSIAVTPAQRTSLIGEFM
jgi:hypothetical protein